MAARLRRAPYRMTAKLDAQLEHMHALVNVGDEDCIKKLRMDRNSFSRLCFLLENVGGLVRTKQVQISEQVAIFLSVLTHHKKNCVVEFDFKRLGYTISHHFNLVLDAVIRLHNILLVTPDPVGPDCTDFRWKWFKGFLGALDGTYIDVRVSLTEKARHRNRKGDVSVNLLAVCNQEMKYTFVLSGWEGSAVDSRVLRDAISRPSGLRVPTGNYYLADNGYTNGPRFLTPYRRVRYHLDEFRGGSSSPQNYRESFNLRHAKASNIIERSFALLKRRWAILRSNVFYSIKIKNRIIMACCLMNNFVRTSMAVDPLEDEVPKYFVQDANNHNDAYYVDQVEPIQEWTNWRESLALEMFNEWNAR